MVMTSMTVYNSNIYVSLTAQSRRLVYLDNHSWAEMRLPAALVYLTVLLLSQQLSSCEALRVAAFNMQRLSTERLHNIRAPLSAVKMHD